MPTVSAGLLLYRIRGGMPEVLLVHPGGPFWRNKDAAAWSIPKGEVSPSEDLLAAAQREFAEETGFVPAGPFTPLPRAKLKSGKIIHAWAVEGEFDPAYLKSNTFTIEWPPRSGKTAEFPEVDRAEFFALASAKKKINAGQAKWIDGLPQVTRPSS